MHNTFYGTEKYRRLITEMPEERLFNSDGTFNNNCLSYEEFCNEWVKDTFYEQKEFAELIEGLYKNMMSRLRIRHMFIKEEREAAKNKRKDTIL